MMKPSGLPAWRSVLFAPAHVQRFVEKAPASGADAIQLDLEDSVPSSLKAEARQKLQGAIEHLYREEIDVIVRINRDLPNCLADLEAAMVEGVSAICLPKVMGPEHVRLIADTMTELEMVRGLTVGSIRLIALIETVESLLAVEAIAQSCPRLAGLALGGEDLSLEMGFEPIPDNLLDPCCRLLYAARLAGVRAYGFPGSIANYQDMDALGVAVERGKSMGFDGAFCIHPKQVEIINSAFTISEAAIEQARKVVAAYKIAVENQRGAVELDSKMIDLPVVERAKELLATINLG